MLNVALTAFILLFFAMGLRRPFVWVLAYLYIDILTPQKISWGLLSTLPVSLIAFVLAFAGWALLDDKRDSRFTLRQGLILVLLVYCGITTLAADFPAQAFEKWAWVWKALVFAVFLPLTLRTRLRIEATALVMILTLGALVIDGGLKTLAGGGGYGTLRLFFDDNSGIVEGSTLSTVAIAVIPLIWWLVRHGTIFERSRLTVLFGIGLTVASLLIPIGTQTRTGLLCIVLLGLLTLRSVRRRALFSGAAALAVVVALPFLPSSYTERMSTIEDHRSDQSASTRVEVWKWTLQYVQDHPFGGGFDAYRGNSIRVETRRAVGAGSNTVTVEVGETFDKARAYHSAYFEMLGEQGWPGLMLWLWLQVLGLWQMERLRARWKNRSGPGQDWQAPLANALQQAQIIYLFGALFVGIAFQPFMFMVIGLQCGLWSYLSRTEAPPVRAGRKPVQLSLSRAGLP
ncbi:putative O-glycosylation ligase (exosortase A-associated) [Novosphingobium kunmingense]|uniref:Putative O-glycosylation ligase (Exosortase A-associated) n=1 Tax=Novosphingobium kunmingense TaxID=1211806 RepID=A0A2N0H7J3_9SPHN|nr:putative O-glycosylation ligase, exosortase A system-associated [Novosphingobium kunmingense]PKB14899.1 putative O-glycosylation ligase (exosortase A-associated) [Novosphingobium kunmingense]